MTDPTAGERRYQELFERSGDVILTLDASGAVVFANPQWVRATGFTLEETEGEGIERWLPARERGVWNELSRRLADTRETCRAKLTFRARNDSEVEMEGWAMVDAGSSGRSAVQLVLHDVTQRNSLERQKQAYLHCIEAQNLELARRTREAEQSNRLKTALLATLSHELRTPINAIYGFTEILADAATGALNEQQASYLGFVRSGAKHLQHLVHDILDLARLEAGRLTLEPRQLRLRPVVEEVVSVVGPLLQEHQVSLQLSVDSDQPVFCDPVRLRQILFNLVCNAVRLSPRGETVTLEAEGQSSFCVVTVVNTGTGIAPALHHRVFEEFQQVSTSSIRTVEDTGLGLAIVRQLVEAQGGKVWVQSEGLEAGCSFGFLLPEAEPSPPFAWIEGALLPERGGETQVLITGVDAAHRRSLTEEIRGEGYSAAEVAHLDDLPVLVESLRPRCVVLDLDTEEAWTALGRCRELSAGPAPLVLVVASQQSKKRAFVGGARGYLIKPLAPRDVSQWIRAHLPDLARGAGSVIVLMPPGAEREGVCERLQEAGFRPITTEEGSQCLRLIRELQPFATIVVLNMPGLDGYQTLIRLRSDPATKRLPAIALTRGEPLAAELPMLEGFTRVLDTDREDWRERVLEVLSEPFVGSAS